MERGRQTCGPSAATEWLKEHRPKIALHPSMTDYCDTCKYLKEQLSRNQAIMNRAQQSGSATEDEIQTLETTKENLETELSTHKDVANKSREYYKSVVDKCKADWKEITRLSNLDAPSNREKQQLESLKHCFTLAVSADYQQSKLIPHWGKTEQPGSTYYLQKVSHDIFGIVDHSEENFTIYLFDERIGSKNTDHTVSFLTHFWHLFSQQHPWARRLALFLDNATNTNKNRYLFAWAMEMVSRNQLDHFHISFMTAGHTKFAPDRLFSVTGNAYKVEDTFTIQDLKAICDRCATTYIESGETVYTWRDSLELKYTNLPGVRKLHDFLLIKTHDGKVVMKVRELCYTGAWTDSKLKVKDPTVPWLPLHTYKEKHYHSLSKEKMANMVTMYDRFIPPSHRPNYLPPQSP